MHDPFEESLRELLNSAPSAHDDEACLGRVLKTANRQVGAGELFRLMGHWLQALMIAVDRHAPARPQAPRSPQRTDKAQ